MSDPITGATTAQEANATTDRTRAQRRYEIARDCLAGLAAKFSHTNDKEAAEISVRWANALLAALEEKR